MARHTYFVTCLSGALLAWFMILDPARAADGPLMKVKVDATDLHRHLLQATMEIPVTPGAKSIKLWYPKWIPGIHGPRGPIQNLGGLRVTTPDGWPLEWRRDEKERYAFHCQLTEGTRAIVVNLDYICNQPSVNSKGIDSYGNAFMGAFDWNTCLLYPDGPTVDQTQVQLSVRLPEGWRHASSLKQVGEEDGWAQFETVSFRELVDSPMLCGRELRSISLDEDPVDRPFFLHMASETASALQLEEAVIGQYRALALESMLMFGSAPFDAYHFLVICSDDLPTMGLEHLSSSLNGVGERGLVDEKKRKGRWATLLPHELVHAWCGKYRCPAGMVTPDYHTVKETGLLWIYEGMTQYLGEVLTVRSGLHTREEFMDRLAYKVNYLMHQAGRQWRSLEDTAQDTYHLRARSPSWSNLRRNQDYYNEGLLIWMEVDALLRERTDGRKSLDDFCQIFFKQHKKGERMRGFDLDEVIQVLQELSAHDWKGLFRQRVSLPMDKLDLGFLSLAGYRVQYATEPSAYLQWLESERKTVYLRDSIGLVVSESGRIGTVVPGSAADRAGLGPGMVVMGVNDRKYSLQRMRDAVADSPVRGRVDLLVLNGEAYRVVEVPYDQGPRYFKLVRDAGKPDHMGSILSPRKP